MSAHLQGWLLQNQTVAGEATWQGGQVHKDDILSAAYLPPSLLATGSYDGAIYVWTLETQNLYLRLRKPQKSRSVLGSS